MQALASFILKDAYKAILVIALFAVLSLLAPPLTWIFGLISGAGVTLVALVWPPRVSLLVTAGGGFAMAAFSLAAVGTPAPALGFVFTLWAPAWLMAQVAQRSGSLVLALETGLYLALAGVWAIYGFVDAPADIWRPYLAPFESLLAQSYPDLSPADIQQVLDQAAQEMTGAVMAAALMAVYGCFLLGRAWQGQVAGGARLAPLFRALRFDRITALFALGVVVGAMLSGWQPLVNAGIVVALAYVVPGLAVIHGLVARAGMGPGWLVGLYMLLVLAAQVMVPFLGFLGLLDTWLDFRSRIGRKPS